MRGTVDDHHEPVIPNRENAAEVIVTDRPGSGAQTARPAALMTRAPGGTDSHMLGMARAALTDTGTARYDGLHQQQHRPPQVTEPVMCRRHHAQVPANKCAFSCVQLPMTSADPVNDPSPELVVSLVLQRAHTDGVAKLGDRYLDGGLPTPDSLAGVFDELLDTGLLVLADPDRDGLRRVTLTTAGHTRHEQFYGLPRPPCLPVPAPQFPTMTPAGRRLRPISSPAPLPAPGGQPDPRPRAGGSGGGPLRWARCPDDGRLHLLRPAEVVVAATGGQAEALCGRSLPDEGLTLTHGSSGAVCLACVDGIPSDPGPRGTP